MKNKNWHSIQEWIIGNKEEKLQIRPKYKFNAFEAFFKLKNNVYLRRTCAEFMPSNLDTKKSA
jgi:hypothetical protein